MVKSKEVVIDGLRVRYLQCGVTNDSPVVFLPGWQATADIYKEVIDVFSNFIILDWPGFGISQKPKTVWGIEEYSDFLKKFLDKLNIQKSILIGHSVGGSIAVYFTSNHPARVDKLVLVASSAIRKKNGGYFLRTKVFFAVAKFGKMVVDLFPVKIKTKIKHVFYDVIKSDYGSVDGLMKKVYQKIIKKDLQKEMRKIECPTYLIWGDKDKSVPIEEAYKTKRLIRNAKLKIIKNAGHYPFLDNQKEWRKIISSFDV